MLDLVYLAHTPRSQGDAISEMEQEAAETPYQPPAYPYNYPIHMRIGSARNECGEGAVLKSWTPCSPVQVGDIAQA
jgi:hypothetical protein